MEEFYVDIDKVVPQDDFTVFVYLKDKRIFKYDAKEVVSRFKQLQDINFFKKTCCIMNHTLAWDIEQNKSRWDCIDIAPEAILSSIRLDNML